MDRDFSRLPTCDNSKENRLAGDTLRRLTLRRRHWLIQRSRIEERRRYRRKHGYAFVSVIGANKAWVGKANRTAAIPFPGVMMIQKAARGRENACYPRSGVRNLHDNSMH
jgi:hypothetical protein